LVSHLGTSGGALLDTLADLHRCGVKVMIHDHADDRAVVETGALMPVADLLVGARRRYSAGAVRGPAKTGRRVAVLYSDA
jgi:hypothetical protein